MDLEKHAARRDATVDLSVTRVHGLSDQAARRRVRSGRYTRLRKGVYGINGAPPTWRQAVRAVILAHPGVAASHQTGVRVLGASLRDWAEDIHVSGDLGERCRLDGVIAHRSGTFEPGDLIDWFGIACTSPLRTVLDMSGTLDAKQLGSLVDQFLRRKLLSLEQLRLRVARTKAAPGRSVATLRKVLAARIPGYLPGESELEAKIVLALTEHGVPLPTQQFKVNLGGAKYRVDMCWPAQRVYLEGISIGFHALSSEIESDARRQNRLVLDGWRPLEITWHMPSKEIADTVRTALALF